MRTIRTAVRILVVALAFVVVGGLPAQATNGVAPQAQTVYPAGTAGTVLATRLNVRAGASASQRQLGVLQRGARVEVLQRQGAWLQIVFRNGPGGKGWVSANYVAVAGEPTPVAPTAARTPIPSQVGTAQGVTAPRAVSYNEPTFSWEWSGLNQMAGTPWYFDIQVYTRSGADPYHIIPATMAQARQENGVWKFDYRYVPRCDSYWVVQIAKGEPGNYQGWISDKSNRQTIGEACPAPTPDCLNCGG
ncbi:MAG TPA: SH3 domain-containing protein [Anaerolineae bacterium]|nr:SH3 domain-containing protein [Anaerolineae bacterium]